MGRRRRLPEIHSSNYSEKKRASDQAINAPVQNSSSDTVLIALNQMLGRSPINQETINQHPDLLSRINWNIKNDYGMLHPDYCRPIMFVHDELVFIVKDDSRLGDYLKLIKFEMEHPPLERDFGIKMLVPFESEVKVGKSLNAMKKVDV